jgi:tRNA(Leu) C34 or U34 (ribose-2'-O)-methylase TrmL
MFAMTTHGSSPFADASFQPGDVFVFGAETRGLRRRCARASRRPSASACR